MDAPAPEKLQQAQTGASVNTRESDGHARGKTVLLRAIIDVQAELVRALLARQPVRERMLAASREGHASREGFDDWDSVYVRDVGAQQAEVAVRVAKTSQASASQAAMRALARLKWDAKDAADVCSLMQTSGQVPRVVVSGASGAIGTELVSLLTALGVRVDRLVRKGSPQRTPNIAGRDWWWEPREGGNVESGALDGAHAVVHLAAEPVVGRWTDGKKRAIRESRVEGTRVLARAAAQAQVPPRVFIAASGGHAYGDRGDDTMTEDAGIGSGFLAEIVRDWEAATASAREAGVRVANLRIGIVLHASSGAIKQMLLPFRMGLGVIVGPGTQHWPWVSMADAVGAIMHVMASNVSGPVNVVGTQEATSASFARALARALDKPLFGTMPAALLRAGLGEQAQGLIMSTRVVPDVLRRSGYSFALPTVEGALRWEVGSVRDVDVAIDGAF